MERYTKIICTLGPASGEEAMLLKMASRGMNVARINSSHGNHEQHKKFIDTVRMVNKKHGYNIKILQDLTGYRIRVGDIKTRKNLEQKDLLARADNLEEKVSVSIKNRLR